MPCKQFSSWLGKKMHGSTSRDGAYVTFRSQYLPWCSWTWTTLAQTVFTSCSSFLTVGYMGWSRGTFLASILSKGPFNFHANATTAGVYPVLSCQTELIANLSSGNYWSQFLWLLFTKAASMSFKVLFILSVMLVWGWYEVVSFWTMPH